MCEHDVASDQMEPDHCWQRRATVGEIHQVNVTAHRVNRCYPPQRFQSFRGIHIAGVQYNIHACQRFEQRVGQTLHAVGDVCVSDQADGEVCQRSFLLYVVGAFTQTSPTALGPTCAPMTGVTSPISGSCSRE